MSESAVDHGRQAVAALLAQLREQANAALATCERWFDGDADAQSALATTLAQLEQVSRLGRFDGVALLATECRAAAAAVTDNDPPKRQAVAEGLVALSGHLSSMQPGLVAPVGAVVSDVNRLRAAHGRAPVDERALFTELLRVRGPYEPPFDGPAPGLPPIATVAQRALDPLKKIANALKKASDPKPALDALRKVVSSLERAAADPVAVEPWWLARVVLDGVAAGRIPLEEAKAALLECVNGAERVAAGGAVADGWVYGLLYALRGAGAEGEGLAAVERVYGLSRVAAELSRGGAGPGVAASAGDARNAVAEAAREELARVRDAFDVFLRSGAADTDLLKPAVARLDSIVSPLQVADLAAAAEFLADVRTSLAALIAGQPLGNMANAIADQMLRAEEVLASGIDGPGDKLREEAIRALVDAAQEELSDLRQALFEASEVGDQEALEGLPAAMGRFAGVLRVSALDDAADLLDTAIAALPHASVEGASLDALAEALVCLELYLAAKRDGHDASAEVLQRARSVLAGVTPQRAAAPSVQADEPPVVSGDADPDLLDIFVAEAREVTDEARRRLAEWRAQPESNTPVAELQRLFHTLKGSGRMVGALRIAEFSKGFEDLTGRITGGEPAPPAVLDLVGAAVAVLPGLVEQIESGTDPGVNLRPLSAAAGGENTGKATGGVGAPILAALTARHLDAVHRWLDASAAGKTSGQLPEGVIASLDALAIAAETLGASALAGQVGALRERLESGAADDPALHRDAAAALDAIQAAVGTGSGDRVDPGAADAYREEAHLLLDRMSDACDALLLDAADAEAVLTMQRVLHTLKGASRVAGFRALSDIAHALEAVLRAIAQERMIVTPRLLWTLQRAFDAMYGMLEPDTAATAGERATKVIDELKQVSGDDRSLPPLSSGADRRRRPRVAAESERVRSDQFDRALVRALSLGLRSAELDRRMHEQTMWNIATIGDMLKALADDAAAIRDLLVRARVAPVHTHASRWRRTVRQAAEDMGRECELRFEGSDTELDRRLLDALVTPFEHLLRNAVAHGIESPFARRAAGKPAAGVIVIRTTLERDGVLIEIEDDGAGIDGDKVRRAARERGLAVPDGTLDARRLLDILATPGFSTAAAVTHAAGFGMGIDTVCAAVRELGGRVELSTKPGAGTRFALYLPNPSPVLSTMLVRTGSALVAVPAQAVVAVRSFEPGAASVEHEGETWPLRALAGAIALDSARTGAEANNALLVRSGQRGLAFIIDENLGRTEVAMHRLRPGDLKGGTCIAGVGLLDGGRLSTVLNVDAAVTSDDGALRIRPHAFVADDSPTARDEVVRKLDRLGWRVTAVEDGSQARQRLSREEPQLIVLDVDMPGYDGLTLVEWLRAEHRLPDTPVLLVSAEFTEQRRERAAGLGVHACVAKPFNGMEFEDALASVQR